MSATTHLSAEHRRMLFEESGISPDVAAARGYRTIRHRLEVPGEFANWQRRLGLLVPTVSPSETSGHQLRPDRPIKRKNGNAPKYETPAGSRIALDVNPLMLEEVRAGAADLWLTEGCKKVDALTSRGLPTVGIIGVWNFAVPGSRSTEPLPCWAYVRLRGRRVYVVYDADARTNPDVQEALRRLVAMLETLGATVLVVYLPSGNGDGKAGVDDYLAAGGTVAELRIMAGPYRPLDVGAERMIRNEKLCAGVEDLERRHSDTAWTWPGADADEDLFLVLRGAAPKHGEIHADGLRVRVSWGTLQVGAKIGSSRTVGKGLARLEARGLLYRDNESREEGKPGAFVLVADVKQVGGSHAKEEKATKSLQGYDRTTLHPQSPRLWASRPKFKPTKKMIREHRLGTRSHLPEPREGLKRLGKKRSHILDRLDAAGGTLAKPILGELIGVRPYDLTRRKTSPKGRDGLLIWLIEAGIVAVDGETVALTDEWLDRLEKAREKGEELEADKQAEKDRRRRSRTYREYLAGRRRGQSSVSKPSAAGLAAVKRSEEKRAEHIAEHEEHARKANIADLEAKTFAKRYVHDRMRELGRIRLELLQQVLRDAGVPPAYALPAAKSLGCTVERLPEYGNEEFVFPPMEGVA